MQQDQSEILKQIKERINSERACKTTLYKILSLCKEAKNIQSIEEEVLKFPEMKVPFQTPQTLTFWLLECGALQKDEKDDDVFYFTSEAGEKALKDELSQDKIAALLEAEKEYASLILSLIEFCKTKRSRQEIEAKFTDHELIQNPKIYPSYFVDLLEASGGIVWDGGWKATQNALQKLEQRG